ncbi:unnamed protein product (macronuclear) [Paramecium tetraurelia]|uniref:Uncharacterized protein n=1 Tax=Paramecium tetraurelia TaxID=5888 RepID=A0D8E6_PARTE|nr:uncharacterized protein GSPATT00014259001 [Paramecium tetraurelia]CAK79313.1 unnamed protein product [Paramecium tetraurelia]|eukprot:XP_001446710.1 hypothetical protein (macronuclear) [Paramecium tetraurelia strain d4-2]
MILKQHQKLISSIQTQFQRVFEKIGAAAYIKNEQNQEIDIEQNTIFIKRIRDQLLQLIEKYQNQKLKKEQLLDFNIISNQIKEEISKKIRWIGKKKPKPFFQLDLLNLEKYEINYLKQVLDEQQLQQINSEEKSKKYQPINKEIKQTNDEFLKLKLTDFFDCEVLLDHLEMLITQSKNIKNIISQNCGNKTSQNSQIMLDLFPNTQVYIFKKSIYNVQKQTLEFYSNCKTLEQIIFNEEFLEKRKNQTNFEQIPTLLYILNFDSLNYQDQGVVHQGEKVNIVQNMIGKLKNDMKVNYEERLIYFQIHPIKLENKLYSIQLRYNQPFKNSQQKSFVKIY